jgi:hypothetical protein
MRRLSLVLALVVAAVVCWAAAGWSSSVHPRSDAKLPAPGHDPKVLGPSLDQAIEIMRRRWPCPADCVE